MTYTKAELRALNLMRQNQGKIQFSHNISEVSMPFRWKIGEKLISHLTIRRLAQKKVIRYTEYADRRNGSRFPIAAELNESTK